MPALLSLTTAKAAAKATRRTVLRKRKKPVLRARAAARRVPEKLLLRSNSVTSFLKPRINAVGPGLFLCPYCGEHCRNCLGIVSSQPPVGSFVSEPGELPLCIVAGVLLDFAYCLREAPAAVEVFEEL